MGAACFDAGSPNHLLATGGEDEQVIVWDTRCSYRPVKKLRYDATYLPTYLPTSLFIYLPICIYTLVNMYTRGTHTHVRKHT